MKARSIQRIFLRISFSAGVVLAACAPASAPSAPTQPPASPVAQAKLTAVPAAERPSPAASPAAQPTASPAASPAAKPAQPAPSPQAFDQRAVADFYQGKTVRIVVGFGAGGLLDAIARLAAKPLSKSIPGNPTVIVENRTGAGGLVAANALANTDPQDGTVIGVNTIGVVYQQLLEAPGIQFDSAKLQWLASPTKDNVACIVRRSVAGSDGQEFVRAKREVTLGSAGRSTNTYHVPSALNALFGTNFRVLDGYAGVANVRQAFDGGEVDAYCVPFNSAKSLDRERVEGQDAPAKIILVSGSEIPNHDLLRGVTRITDLATSDEQRQLLRIIGLQDDFFPNFLVGPGVSQERLRALRQATRAAFEDPEFVEGAAKLNLTVSPSQGEQVQQGVEQLIGISPSTREKLKALIS